MNLAAIDIGTNSTRLLISRFENEKFIPLIREMQITRLGKGIKDSGSILDESAKNTIKVLKKYKKLINKFDVKNYRAVGTSVLRRAVNKDNFISKTFVETGLSIEVINGLEEAKLSFNGVVKSLILTKKIFNFDKILVVDIGGGSSEFILGDTNFNILKSTSLDIGSVRLTEDFIHNDPPSKNEINFLRNFIKNTLSYNLKDFIKYNVEDDYKNLTIIGLAGTFSSLASISINLKKYSMDKLNYLPLEFNKINDIFFNLCKLNLHERKKVIGLDPARADIIIGGTAIVIEVLNYFKKEKIFVSENDILDGIIYSLINF
jgi:exopolyphosphatase/guanosine-5'-triphosphate,3'-diphosphate pyrophosphatase